MKTAIWSRVMWARKEKDGEFVKYDGVVDLAETRDRLSRTSGKPVKVLVEVKEL